MITKAEIHYEAMLIKKDENDQEKWINSYKFFPLKIK